MAERADEVAAVITEPVQGAAASTRRPTATSQGCAGCATSTGRCLIFDEVITGFGRLGTWFAAEHYGVQPDMITFAKAVTSGYQPLGGVFVGAAVARRAGGRPGVHPAPRLHVLGPRRGLRRRARQPGDHRAREPDRARPIAVGTRLGGGLRALAADGVIDHVRGDGAMWAAGLRADQDANAIRDRMQQLGVVVRAIGADTLTFCPPLVITDDQIDKVVDAVAEAAAV